MTEFRQIEESELDEFAQSQCNAYPAFFGQSESDRVATKERLQKSTSDSRITNWGVWRDDSMIGSMRFHDFRVNVRGTVVPTCGIGAIAVDLLHKKQGVAKELMQFYHHHFCEKQYALSILWPFRPDFYRKMGYGFGAKMHRYTILPASLPASAERHKVRQLQPEDLEAVLACHNRLARERTGMVEETLYGIAPYFLPGSPYKVYGYEHEGILDGYFMCAFTNLDKVDFLRYDLRVFNVISHTRESFAGLMGFLQSQLDQVRHMIIETDDDAFPYCLSDPRHANGAMIRPVHHVTNESGIGIMYRIMDTRTMLGQLNEKVFGPGSMTIQFDIGDTFVPANGGIYLIRFEDGSASVVDKGASDVTVTMNIAEFSSMFMGAVGLDALVRLGQASISDDALLSEVCALFAVSKPPLCLTAF